MCGRFLIHNSHNAYLEYVYIHEVFLLQVAVITHHWLPQLVGTCWNGGSFDPMWWETHHGWI